MTENSAKKQRGRPFQKGQSGNPDGKPKGTRNATTRALEALLDGEAETLTRKAIELAQNGDLVALRMCLDRILPPRKDRPLTFDMPTVSGADEAANVMASILAGVAAGQVTPGEASELAKVVETYLRAVETADLAARIEKLEKATER